MEGRRSWRAHSRSLSAHVRMSSTMEMMTDDRRGSCQSRRLASTTRGVLGLAEHLTLFILPSMSLIALGFPSALLHLARDISHEFLLRPTHASNFIAHEQITARSRRPRDAVPRCFGRQHSGTFWHRCGASWAQSCHRPKHHESNKSEIRFHHI